MKVLCAEELTCGYAGRTVIENLCLQARAGEVMALIGPNGAGKSTLLRAMARLLRPRGGRVLFADRDLWRLHPREVARRVGMSPQGENPAPITVERMVALGRAPHRGWLLPLTAADRTVVDQALERTGLTGLRERSLDELSGGERQRAILARVLAQAPQVLLLDEPVSHLDLRYQSEILGLVRRQAHEEGLTVVVSLHDLNLAALCADRIALLREGGLVSVGPGAEVLTAERLSEVYGVPIVVAAHPVYGTPLVLPAMESGHA